jgi:hypothetical protein
VCGEPDQFTGQQIQGPTGAARGRARTGGRDQERLLFARELAARSGTRLFAECRRKVAEHKAALGPVDGRAANAEAPCDRLVARSGVSRQQNLRPLELACRMFAAAQKRREFGTLGLVQVDPVAYIHLCLLMVRGTDEQLNRMAGVSRPKLSRPSRASTWRLSTSIRACTAALRPKPTCSSIFASARLPSIRWC